MSAGVAFPIAYDNRLIFMGTDVSNNAELWSSDGTSFGTYMLREFVPGNTTGGSPKDFTIMNGVLYFLADDGSNGYEIWSYTP